MKTILIGVVLTILFITPAVAQSQCGSFQAIINALNEKFGEQASAMGATSAGHLFILFLNETTGSWTVVMNDGTDRACIATGGDGWQPPNEAMLPGTAS